MTNHVALAGLVSFGSMVLAGMGAPTNTDNESSTLTITESADRPQSVASHLGFGIPQYGYAPGPLKTVTVDCMLALLADPNVPDSGKGAAVEDAFGVWWNAWCSTYAWDGNTASGQIGDLCVESVDGTTYVAQAELLDLESANVPGVAGEQQLKLTFSLLEALRAGTPASAGSPSGSLHLPATRLIGFGPMVFTGQGAPTNTDSDSSVFNVKATAARPRQPVSSTPYGYSVIGLSIASLSTAQMSTTLYLKAADGLSAVDTFQALENAYSTWLNAWQSMYTSSGQSVSGQVGLLEVEDAHGTRWTALAELTDFPAAPEPGVIGFMDIPLTFNLLSQFGYAADNSRWGSFVWGTGRWG